MVELFHAEHAGRVMCVYEITRVRSDRRSVFALVCTHAVLVQRHAVLEALREKASCPTVFKNVAAMPATDQSHHTSVELPNATLPSGTKDPTCIHERQSIRVDPQSIYQCLSHSAGLISNMRIRDIPDLAHPQPQAHHTSNVVWQLDTNSMTAHMHGID